MPSMSTAEVVTELVPHMRGLSVDGYHALVDAGLLGADDDVELLRGVIVEMTPTNPPHHIALEWLTMWLARRVPDGLHVRVQSPWSAPPDSEPEPDLVVAPAGWHRADRTTRAPRVAVLVVEVADSSLRRDLVVKSGIYADAGVPEYWVVDLAAREVVVHRDPVEGAYTDVRRTAAPEVLRAAGTDVPLAELFGFLDRGAGE